MDCHAPENISMQLEVVLKIIRPVAGDAIALRWALVKRGGKKPCVVENTSKAAELFRVCVLVGSINTPSVCANELKKVVITKNSATSNDFISGFYIKARDVNHN